MKKTPTSRMLPVEMQPEERAAKAQELASRLQEYDVLEEEKKARTADLTAKMKQSRVDARVLRIEVATNKTARLVDCWTEANLQRRAWVVMRADTGEVVEDYPMTAQEIDEARQIDFTRKRDDGKGKDGEA